MVRASASVDPALRSLRRLGVFGGSFDPPHLGHLAMARTARAARDLEHVLWVPAARPPHKPERALAAAGERVRMLELLLADEPQASIWTVELERAGPSYTVDTLRALAQALGPQGPELHLVLGTDNLPGLAGWRAVEEVLALARPVVLPRRGAPANPPELARLGTARAREVRDSVLAVEPVDVSSTEVRAALRAGSPRPALVPPALWEYLRTRGIYAS